MAMDTSKLTEKAREAVQRRNYEYAIDLYQQALALNADDTESRKELRAVASRYVKEKGISPSAAWIKGIGSVFKILLGSKKNAEKTMIECEQFLANDPGNVWVLTRLGRSAMHLGYHKTAVSVFDEVRQTHPENVANLFNLKNAYKAKGDVDAAISTCQMILKAKPTDHDASQELRDLSAEQSSQVFEVGAQKGSTSIVKDSAALEEHEIDIHEIRSAEQRDKALGFAQEKLAGATTADPRHLATFHANIGDLWLTVAPNFEEAEKAYAKAKELQPTDYTYVFKLDDLKIRRFDAGIAELAARVKAAPADPAAKTEYAKLKAERDQFRTKSYELRVKVRPMDLAVAFTLGSIYFEAKSLDLAIGQFQRTVNDPARRIDSLNVLGICFSRNGKHELGAKQFVQALSGMEVMNEKKKVILYNLGDTYHKMAKTEEARKTFTELYEADINFKDVSKRLEQMKGSS